MIAARHHYTADARVKEIQVRCVFNQNSTLLLISTSGTSSIFTCFWLNGPEPCFMPIASGSNHSNRVVNFASEVAQMDDIGTSHTRVDTDTRLPDFMLHAKVFGVAKKPFQSIQLFPCTGPEIAVGRRATLCCRDAFHYSQRIVPANNRAK